MNKVPDALLAGGEPRLGEYCPTCGEGVYKLPHINRMCQWGHVCNGNQVLRSEARAEARQAEWRIEEARATIEFAAMKKLNEKSYSPGGLFDGGELGILHLYWRRHGWETQWYAELQPDPRGETK